MKRRSDEEISAPLYAFDAEVRSQYGCFAGVDEAGRGPLCGPVCVAACILDPENPVYGINDSKKLTEKKREALFDEICEKALAYRIVFVGPEVIDRENILNATMGGMQQAVEELDIVPNLVLVDGNRTPAGLQIPAQPVVKGDATSASIGAASVLAKVSRDRYMLELDKQYPQYQLAKHKGYPTKLHYELIAQYGIPRLMLMDFLANTTGTLSSLATMAAMPMPLASMVSTLLMGLPANRRFHSRAISRNSGISIWWLMKLSTLSTFPSRTMPSARIRSSSIFISSLCPPAFFHSGAQSCARNLYVFYLV